MLGGVGLSGGVEEGGVFLPEGGVGGVELDGAALISECELELAELACCDGAALGDAGVEEGGEGFGSVAVRAVLLCAVEGVECGLGVLEEDFDLGEREVGVHRGDGEGGCMEEGVLGLGELLAAEVEVAEGVPEAVGVLAVECGEVLGLGAVPELVAHVDVREGGSGVGVGGEEGLGVEEEGFGFGVAAEGEEEATGAEVEVVTGLGGGVCGGREGLGEAIDLEAGDEGLIGGGVAEEDEGGLVHVDGTPEGGAAEGGGALALGGARGGFGDEE